MSEAGLLALKGPPTGKLVAGSRSIYRWPDISVVVQDGVVARVTPNSTAPAPTPPAAAEAATSIPEPTAVPVHYTSNFGTHWQDESQYIVEDVSADLTEMFIYARTGRVPAVGELSVAAVEDGTDGYIVNFQDAGDAPLQARIVIHPTIFSADTFQPLLAALATRYGALEPTDGIEVAGLLDSLTDLRAEVIESANQGVSAELERSFSSPKAHEQAALVLGAFALREHSGKFFQILAGLCRASAHLAFAQALRSGTEAGTEGKVAEAAQLSLVGNTADSQALLARILANQSGVDAWRRALEILNTGDFAKYQSPEVPTLFERFERFSAKLHTAEAATWDETAKLPEDERELPEWGRRAMSSYVSVQVGHRIVETQLKAELGELGATYKLARGAILTREELVRELNAPPVHCVTAGADGRPHPRVISWGLWAGFFQRQLCLAICSNYNILARQWGVPDDAARFRREVDQDFWGLQLYPFVRRQNADTEAYYHSAQDDEMALVRSQPQVVPAYAWNYVGWQIGSIPKYCPPPHPFINEWHKRNPPPGTAYDIHARVSHPSLMNQPDTVARLERLHAIDPWELDISWVLLKQKYKDQATGDETAEAFKDVSGYVPVAADDIAQAYAMEKRPDQFLAWETRAAQLNPRYYYGVAKYFKDAGMDAQAIEAYESGFGHDDDAVRVANLSDWVIKYYEGHGRPDDATRLADKAEEAYSAGGIEAKAWLLESRKDLDGALDLYKAVKERYNDSKPLIDFLFRVRSQSPSAHFDAELNAASEKVVKGGLVAVSMASFSGVPDEGALVEGENEQTKRVGLAVNDVIVALNGFRVRDFKSYSWIRGHVDTKGLDLIFWHDGSYRQISATPPEKRFGVKFGNFPPKAALP